MSVLDEVRSSGIVNLHQKLNGTESQRTPFSKLRSSKKILRFFRVRETWVLLEISWITTITTTIPCFRRWIW